MSTCSGLQNVFTDKVLDLIVVLAKFYIYKCKWHETASSFKAFLRILTNRYTLERYLHITIVRNYMILTYSGFPTRDCLLNMTQLTFIF